MGVWVPQREDFELERNQHEAAVQRDLRVKLPQSRQPLCGILVSAKHSGHGVNAFPDPLLEEHKKNVFLAFEVGVKGPARVAGTGGDVFEASGLESVPGEDGFSGGEESAAGRLGAGRLSGASWGLERRTRGILAVLRVTGEGSFH